MKKKIMIFMLLVVFLVGMAGPDPARAADSYYTEVVEYIRSLGEINFTFPENYHYVVFENDGAVCLIAVYNKEPYASIGSDSLKLIVKSGHSLNYYDLIDSVWTVDGAKCKSNYSFQSTFYFTEILASSYDVLDSEGEIYFNNDTIYDFEDWCSDAGLNCAASSNETETTFPFAYDDEYWYIVRKNRVSGSEYTWYLSKINAPDSWTHFLYSTERALSNSLIGVADLDEALTMESVNVAQYVYDAAAGGWLFVERPSYILQIGENYVDDIGITYSSAMPIVYSSTDIYSDKDKSSVSYTTSTEFIDYDFVEPTPVPTPSITGGTSSVLNALTSVYANADMSSEIIDYLSAGTTVYIFGLITGESSGKSFYHIKYYTDEAIQEGYILSQYISSGSSGGSGSVDSTIGGDAKPGSYLDFIVTLYSMLWSRVFSIPMNVDGYSISMQQIVVYGALAVIVGGAVYMFLTGRKR